MLHQIVSKINIQLQGLIVDLGNLEQFKSAPMIATGMYSFGEKGKKEKKSTPTSIL